MTTKPAIRATTISILNVWADQAGQPSTPNQWNGFDFAAANGDTIRFSEEFGDIRVYCITPSGVAWTSRFDPETPSAVVRSAIRAALHASRKPR